ncbi:MAG TPA: hypothetical protein VGB87_19955 [Vicinamibacteria bacterium]
MTSRAGWALYFVGRGLQLFGLALVTRAVFMSSARDLGAMVALTGVGVVFFLAGWLLARKDPGGRS